MKTVEQQVRDFVIENFLFGRDGDSLKNDESFIARGLLDSTGVMELATFVEETFDMTIADDELVPDNMDSVENLVAFVERKRAG